MKTTKSPDEIKKGLEACNGRYPCDECPYRKTPKGKDCKTERNMDAIALIQQLQAENAQQARCIENMTDKLNAMNDEVAKLQAERDAAVNDMYAECACDVCKHNDRNETICPRGIEVDNCFEWRGVTKEDVDA